MQSAGQMPKLHPDDDTNPMMREVALFHVHTKQQWNLHIEKGILAPQPSLENQKSSSKIKFKFS